MKENSTLAEMSDKEGRRMLRIYPMSLANNGSLKERSLRDLSNNGFALFNYVNPHDLYNDYTPDSVLSNISDVMCDMVSVLYFMSTHHWEKYKVFILQKGIYEHERILAEICKPTMMRLTHIKEDKPGNLRRYVNVLKASLRGMADGRFG